MQGAGKTSLMKAILNQGRKTTTPSLDAFPMDIDVREGIAGGLLYSDSTGVNLQVFTHNYFLLILTHRLSWIILLVVSFIASHFYMLDSVLEWIVLTGFLFFKTADLLR